MAGNPGTPKMVRMSAGGHFDPEKIFFGRTNKSNMAAGGHL